LEPDLDPAHGTRDLARHEILAATRGLVVEKNAIAGVESVGLTVVDGVPVRSAFGGGVGGAGVKGGGFGLRRRGGPEHLGGPGLVVADVGAAGVSDVGADGLEEAQGAGGDDVGGVVGDLEGNGNVRLGGEVVDLVGKNSVEPAAERGGVGEIRVVELHARLVGVVGIDVYVVDALRVEVGGATDQAVHLVSLVEQEFREVGTVLSRDSGYQCNLPRRSHLPVGGRSGSHGVLHWSDLAMIMRHFMMNVNTESSVPQFMQLTNTILLLFSLSSVLYSILLTFTFPPHTFFFYPFFLNHFILK